MKCSWRFYPYCPYITAEFKISLRSVARQRSLTQVAKGLSMGKRWLLSWMRCGVVSTLSFPDNSGVRYFNQAWLSKATDTVGGKVGDIR
jgi:hypothetical protein